jgi:DNA mismatch endonuclease, patch repair protein
MSRSQMMRAVRSRNTAPERIVRRGLFRMGFRFRLQRRDLPGTPDLFVLRYRVVVFVNGCFWHQHGCASTTRPRSNTEFWNRKLDGNASRDVRTLRELFMGGFRVAVVWECSLKKNADRSLERLADFITGDEEFIEI